VQTKEQKREANKKFLETHPDYHKNYYRDNPEKCREKRRKSYARHSDKERAYQQKHYKENRETILSKQKTNTNRKEYFKKYYRELKKRVIASYGGQCECCSVDTFEFLTIDHIYGGGHKERKSKTGAGFYARLEKMGFPKDKYRCLCMNCNFAIGIYGYCPHTIIEP
jgi:hypothetical protein